MKKSVLVVGDLNDKLKSVLNKLVNEEVIYTYVNYEIYNNMHRETNEHMGLLDAEITNVDFCNKFLYTTKNFDEWIILKGDIHTDDFLRILIKMEKSFDPVNQHDLFLSHVVELTNDKIKFYLSDGALNVKQIEDKDTLGHIIENAQNYILDKKEGISKVDPVINTAIVLAANNVNVPGCDTARNMLNMDKLLTYDLIDRKHTEIKQFDECFSAEAWCLKNKDADAMVFTYPDIIITPDITVGNVIWKSLTILNNWYAKGYVIGGRLNTVLLSRSDSEKSYYESIKGICQ